jgi:hypothetical protein
LWQPLKICVVASHYNGNLSHSEALHDAIVAVLSVGAML